MKSPGIILSIPKPCHEDWNKMNPDERSRFCNACQKSIIDFSQLTDDEIIEMLKKGNETCGRFDNSQLNRIVPVLTYLYQPKTIPWWKSLLIATAVFLFKSPVASALNQNPPSKEITIYPQSVKSEMLVSDSEKIVVKGNVQDAKTGEALIGASIAVYDSCCAKIGITATDIDGNFQISVPKIPGLTLECFYLGYDRFVQNIKDANSNIQFGLTTPEMIMGAIIITEPGSDDFSITKKYLDR